MLQYVLSLKIPIQTTKPPAARQIKGGNGKRGEGMRKVNNFVQNVEEKKQKNLSKSCHIWYIFYFATATLTGRAIL